MRGNSGTIVLLLFNQLLFNRHANNEICRRKNVHFDFELNTAINEVQLQNVLISHNKQHYKLVNLRFKTRF